jgi:ankyrin repeat protein
MSAHTNDQEIAITLETATNWARSNREWDKVYRYLFLHPKDFFVISPPRRWSIAHQVVYHGDVDLLKRILALADDQIDIRSKSTDNKTLLDVAIEKRNGHPQMYTYVEHLFDQDQLIQEAKQSNWRLVTELLDKHQELANEKPPYSPYFLLHYVVQNGDANILQDLLDHYQFLTNVLNAKNETPLDMAMRLNKNDMCTILRPKTVGRPPFTHKQTSADQPQTPTSSVASTKPKQSESMSSPASKTMDPKAKANCIGFGGVVLEMTQNGDFSLEPSTLVNSSYTPPPPLQSHPPSQPTINPQPQKTSEFKHVHTRKTIVSEYPPTSWDPPAPLPPLPTTSISANEQLMKNFTCPLTNKIFVDPVIAPDGQTYERSAILRWINQNHTSPMTGASMNAEVRDNIEIKKIIQLIQQQ